MVPLSIVFVGKDEERPWKDVDQNKVVEPVGILQATVLEGGTQSGKPSVVFQFNLPDGTVLLTQTTGRLMCNLARAILAKYPNIYDDSPAGAPDLGPHPKG